MSPPIIIKVFERDVDNSLLNELEKLVALQNSILRPGNSLFQ